MKLNKHSSDYPEIQIDWIELKGRGKIGLTAYPGKFNYFFSDSLKRDLLLIKKSAVLLLSLIQKKEFDLLHLQDLGEIAEELGLEWIHAPIIDFSIPDKFFMNTWQSYSRHLSGILKDGNNIVIHCRGGYGRTGLVTAMLLIDMGFEPSEAVKLIRNTRSGSIETYEQEKFCLGYRRKSI